MYTELSHRKAKIEKQLIEISLSLSGMEVPNLELAFSPSVMSE